MAGSRNARPGPRHRAPAHDAEPFITSAAAPRPPRPALPACTSSAPTDTVPVAVGTIDIVIAPANAIYEPSQFQNGEPHCAPPSANRGVTREILPASRFQ